MTIVEALKRSKETGDTFSRPTGFGGWIKWHETHRYHDLTAEDLMADDWEPSADTIHRITGGRWRLLPTSKE